MNCTRLFFVFLLTAVSVASAKDPLPTQEQQRSALREHRQLLTDSDCESKLAAANSAQNPTDVFVMLSAARTQAAERGDAVLAFSIAEQIEEQFEFPKTGGSALDRMLATVISINAVGKNLVFVTAMETSLDESRKHQDAILRIVAQLLAEHRYEDALVPTSKLKTMAETADDSDALRANRKTFAALKRMVNGDVGKLPDALQRMDVDRLAVGKALAIYTGDLDQAAQYLSEASRKDISDLAKEELAFRENKQKDSDVSEDLLDRWVELASKLPNDLRRNCYVFARAHCCWLLDNGNGRTQYPKAVHVLRTLKEKNAQPDLLVVRMALGYPNIYPILRAQFSYKFPPEDTTVPRRLFFTETEWQAQQSAKNTPVANVPHAPKGTFSDPRYNELREKKPAFAKYSDEQLAELERRLEEGRKKQGQK